MFIRNINSYEILKLHVLIPTLPYITIGYSEAYSIDYSGYSMIGDWK